MRFSLLLILFNCEHKIHDATQRFFSWSPEKGESEKYIFFNSDAAEQGPVGSRTRRAFCLPVFINKTPASMTFSEFQSAEQLLVTEGCSPSFTPVVLFVTPWTVSYQVPLSKKFPRKEYWSGLPFLPPWVYLTQGSNPSVLHGKEIPHPHTTSNQRRSSHKTPWGKIKGPEGLIEIGDQTT